MAKDMIGLKVMAEKWNVSQRRLCQLCNAGEIEGAVKCGKCWKIPADAQKPEVIREKKGSGLPNENDKTASLPGGYHLL